jgi:RNA polymerase sigma factor (sigma-70 family)
MQMSQSSAGNTVKGTKEGNELALLDRVRRGDRGAFSELYRLYHQRLYGYLRRLLRNPATVEEVLDDVMLVVWKDARKFRGDAAVSSWVFGIAYRKALTAMRAEHRYQAPLDRSADASAIAGESERHTEWIRAALTQLSADHRQVVELTYFGGFSYQDIADIANCPVNTVKTRMFHARRRLKVLLPALAGQVKEQSRERA